TSYHMEGCDLRGLVSSRTGHRSFLGNMVYSYSFDYNLLCRRVHSHWADDHLKRGLADEISYARLYSNDDFFSVASCWEKFDRVLSYLCCVFADYLCAAHHPHSRGPDR